MDSKQIFNASRHRLLQVCWDNSETSEWSYCGFGGEFQTQKFQQQVSSVFPGETIFLVIDRRAAYETHSSDAAKEIQLLLNEQSALRNREIVLWNHDFTTVMVLSSIGVFKVGRILG